MALAALMLPGALLIAQDAPVKVCIISRVSDAPQGTGQFLADALSHQKLRSGRVINAVPLSAKWGNNISNQMQSNACDYLVDLWPWKTLERSISSPTFAGPDGVGGAPQDAQTRGASAANDLQPELPALNYELWKAGQKHPIEQGTQFSRRVYVKPRATTYKVDYSALAARIAGKIPA
jgi:hypothetical protein